VEEHLRVAHRSQRPSDVANREILTVDVAEIKSRLAQRQPELMARFESLVG
jgi:hypothetical protein